MLHQDLEVNVFVLYYTVWEADIDYWIFRNVKNSTTPIVQVTYLTNILFEELQVREMWDYHSFQYVVLAFF